MRYTKSINKLIHVCFLFNFIRPHKIKIHYKRSLCDLVLLFKSPIKLESIELCIPLLKNDFLLHVRLVHTGVLQILYQRRNIC